MYADTQRRDAMHAGTRWSRVWRFGGIAALGLALVAGGAGPARAAAKVIRLGSVGFPGSLFINTADEFAKRANEALKGKYEVKVFHSSQLGNDSEMLKWIKVGVLEMFMPSTMMSTIDERYGVFEMPYLFKDRAQVKRVAEDPQVRKMLYDPLPAKGVRVLGFWLWLGSGLWGSGVACVGLCFGGWALAWVLWVALVVGVLACYL